MLKARFDLPIATGNDSDLGVIAEHLRGAAVGYDDVAFISGGVGIGVGFISGGAPLRGWGGYAGEVGHLPVDVLHGIKCRCGARGCWETKVGENHLLEAAGLLPGGGPHAVAEVMEAANQGQRRAAEAVAHCAFWTGVGLGAIINTMNPAVIVLGGLLAAIWDERPDAVSASIDSVALKAPRSQVDDPGRRARCATLSLHRRRRARLRSPARRPDGPSTRRPSSSRGSRLRAEESAIARRGVKNCASKSHCYGR